MTKHSDPKPKQYVDVSFSVFDINHTPIIGALVSFNGGIIATNNDGYCIFSNCLVGAVQGVTITADGFNDYINQPYMVLYPNTSIPVQLSIKVNPVKPLPLIPDRWILLTSQITFQGLAIQLKDQVIKSWGPEYCWLDDIDRALYRAAKKSNGDKILEVALSGNYDEAPSFTYPILGKDFSQNLDELYRIVREAIMDGFYIKFALAGDGESIGGDVYNDPQGWTYGYQWLMDNFVRVHNRFIDLDPYIIWTPGFDGVVPAWQPRSKVNKWLEFARGVIGDKGYLGLEPSTGYADWSGDGVTDYRSPAGQALDIIFCEFDGLDKDSFYQVAARLVPTYNRPSDQPSGDDPNPPHYLTQTPRGPQVACGYEYDTYYWVRNMAAAQVVIDRNRVKSVGFLSVG